MKYTNKWLLALLPVALLASCAEDVFEPYSVDAPASLAELQYLKEYKVLKDYASGAAVKIGAAVDAAAYNNQGAIFGVASSNFNEVAYNGNHAALVRDNGGVNSGAFSEMIKIAEGAGQTVFGPSLLSNNANNGKYLSSIIADKQDPNFVPTKTEVKKHDDTRCIRLMATEKQAEAWDNQFWLVFSDYTIAKGDKYEYKMTVRADKEGASISTQTHKEPGGYIHWAAIGNVDFPTEWKEVTASGVFGDDAQVGGYSIAFNINDFAPANNYYFKDVSFKINGTEVIKNGDLKTDDVSSFVSKVNNGTPGPSEIVNGYDYITLDFAPMEIEMEYNKPCIVVHSSDIVDQAWDSQFWIMGDPSSPFKAGDKWEYVMKVRADKEAAPGTQVHKDAGGYVHWAAIGNPQFTTEWQEITGSGTFTAECEGGYSIAFNLNDFKEANNYYFASISFKVNGKELIKNVNLTGSDNSNFIAKEYPAAGGSPCTILPSVKYTIKKDTPGIPLSDEEKADTITFALNNYIAGVMKASEGKVTAWDVLSNVLTDDGNSLRDIADAKTDFNWGEILGEEEFARVAVKTARDQFAAAGGNAADLKLFINESGLDNSAKMSGLNSWLGKWEADGATKIDGISTSITAEFNENADAQKANEDKITALFNSLKETGRLIRISGFDIKYVAADGATLSTAAMTVDQGKKMGDFYKFIIKKYLEIIPANQRYGIFVSNITDNGDEPNGLWTGKYSRKPQYGGFAEGLQ